VEVPSKDKLSYYASDLDIIDIIIRDNVDVLYPMLVTKLLANARAWQEKRLQTQEMQEKYSERQLPFVDFGMSRKTSGAKWYDVIVRFKCCFLRHYFGVSYKKMHDLIKNHIGVKLFLGLSGDEEIPWKSILQVRESEFGDDLLHEINEKFLLPVAKKEKIVLGEKVRWDSTVIEENITYPTDAKLLHKWVAMIKHMANKVTSFFGACVQKTVAKLEVTTRDMKLALLDIVKYAQGRTNDAKDSFKKTYKVMIVLAKTYKEQALALADTLEKNLAKNTQIAPSLGDAFTQPKAPKISHQESKIITKYISKIRSTCGKLDRVIKQTERRVVNEESVPMCEKLLSYCSETVAIIQKWKEGKPIEFGRKLMITEAENRFIVQRNVPPGNPNDTTLLTSSFEEAVRVLWKPPKKASYDRWFRDENAIDTLTETHKTKFAIPKRWKKNEDEKKHEKQKRFVDMQAWRAGWEAEVNCLKRDCDLKNVRVRWDAPMKTHIWLWILTNNLMVLAKKLKPKYQRKWLKNLEFSYIHL